jgi:hypothetical protein
LHREEFTQPHLLPNALVRFYRTVSHITFHLKRLFFSLLHLSSSGFLSLTPGRYPARCPSVFGLSSFSFLIEKRLPDLFRLPGKSILARNVQQIQ